MAKITIRADGGEEGYALEAAAVTLGRGLESDIRLKDIKASRCHCKIVKTPNGYECVDLSSGNGTFVNGVQIQQHKLRPGDKIQIGTTLITFQDGEAASEKRNTDVQGGRKSTGQIPKATGAPNATAGARSPNRKTTTMIPKKTPPAGQAGSQGESTKRSLPRSGAARQTKGPTSRTGAMRSKGFASVTDRFHAEARRKKTNPIPILIAVLIAIPLVIVGGMLFLGGDDVEIIRANLKDRTERAAKAYSEGRADEAVRLYKEAERLILDNEVFQSDLATIRATLKEIEGAKAAGARALEEFEDFKRKFDSKALEPRPLLDIIQDLERKYRDAGYDWLKDLATRKEAVLKQIAETEGKEKLLEFQNKRGAIQEKYNIGKPEGGDWSGALKEWTEYLANKDVKKDSLDKAQNEVHILQRRAREEAERLKKRTQRLVEDNKKADALEALRKARPRFEGTEAAEVIDKLLREHDK